MELKEAEKFPWQPQSFVTGNLAIGNLRNNLMARLKDKKGIHVETLLVAIGSITGFAAQNAALIRGAHATKQTGTVPPRSILIVAPKESGPFLFGDWINGYIINERNKFPLYGFAAGAAIQAGIKPENLPDHMEIFGHVAATLGTTEFGKIRALSGNAPALQPIEFLVKGLWNFAKHILLLPPPAQMSKEPPLEEEHWPIITSIVASQLISQSKNVLSPSIAYAMVMEAAIIASKVFPTAIEQGKWTFEVREGQLAIRRNPTLTAGQKPF